MTIRRLIYIHKTLHGLDLGRNIILIVYFEIIYGGFIKMSFFKDLQMEENFKLWNLQLWKFKKIPFHLQIVSSCILFLKIYLIIQLDVIWPFNFSFKVDWNPFGNLIFNVPTLALGSWPRKEFAKVQYGTRVCFLKTRMICNNV